MVNVEQLYSSLEGLAVCVVSSDISGQPHHSAILTFETVSNSSEHPISAATSFARVTIDTPQQLRTVSNPHNHTPTRISFITADMDLRRLKANVRSFS